MLKQLLKVIRRINKQFQFLIAATILFLPDILSAQTISPFNKLEVKDTAADYSFIVSGHFHGASTTISSYPASTLLANIDTLNTLNSFFLMSLGDLFLDVNDTYIDHYRKSLFNKLQMPLFNAVGNHDLSNGNLYEKVYGKTFYSFNIHSELFIVLNTELNDGSISDEQLTFFKKAISKEHIGKIKRIFIFSHRPIWAENGSRYKGLFTGNTRTTFGKNNYEQEIKPLLKDLSREKPVYWMSGSMADAPASFFYDQDPETNVTFIQTAIRDLPRDAVLQVNVSNEKIFFKGISFTGQSLEPVTNYNLDYWNKSRIEEKPFNYRLLPYLTMEMLSHYYFWIGLIFGSVFILILILFYKRWKRKE